MSAAADALMGIFGFKRVEIEMKTDRELLELAALAAGYEFNFISLVDGAEHPFVKRGELWVDWLPLTDDGDALRLALRLKLSVMIFEKSVFVQSCPDSVLSFSDVNEMEMLDGNNDESAVRRAIVRAAAAIGESMK